MNKTVVISGASSGLGLAISEAISEKFDVIGLGRRPLTKNYVILTIFKSILAKKKRSSIYRQGKKKLSKTQIF